MQFCPTCANLLLVANTGHPLTPSPSPPSLSLLLSRCLSSLSTGFPGYRFYCPCCPYVAPLLRAHRRRHLLPRKQVDDVLGGADAWKNVDSTEAECAKCGTRRAYFMQIQTRSADEPMTTFYKCTNHTCGYQWKEN